jgi:hypothetical protein
MNFKKIIKDVLNEITMSPAPAPVKPATPVRPSTPRPSRPSEPAKPRIRPPAVPDPAVLPKPKAKEKSKVTGKLSPEAKRFILSRQFLSGK